MSCVVEFTRIERLRSEVASAAFHNSQICFALPHHHLKEVVSARSGRIITPHITSHRDKYHQKLLKVNILYKKLQLKLYKNPAHAQVCMAV